MVSRYHKSGSKMILCCGLVDETVREYSLIMVEFCVCRMYSFARCVCINTLYYITGFFYSATARIRLDDIAIAWRSIGVSIDIAVITVAIKIPLLMTYVFIVILI